MPRRLVSNACIVLAVLAAAGLTVALDVRGAPVSVLWGLTLVAPLLAFSIVNAGAFAALKPAMRGLALWSLVLALWAGTVLLAVVLGVNLKLVLGGTL